MKIHLDTDIGTDPDDACAVAMLLGWPGVEIVGITSTHDPGGHRAGYLGYVLELAGRGDIPVAAGAAGSLGHDEAEAVRRRQWPSGVVPRPASAGAALDLLEYGVEQGATVVGIGPLSNLALVELARPGTLRQAPVVVMGGWIEPPEPGLPPWGPDRDTNIRFDPHAARLVVGAASRLTMVTLPVTLKTQLRVADLPRLRASGRLGRFLAEQSLAHARQSGRDRLGQRYTGLPDDLVNFHYDPVTCAIAAGWPGAVIEATRLRPVAADGVLRFERAAAGQRVDLVVDLDGPGFTETWLTAVEAAQS